MPSEKKKAKTYEQWVEDLKHFAQHGIFPKKKGPRKDAKRAYELYQCVLQCPLQGKRWGKCSIEVRSVEGKVITRYCSCGLHAKQPEAVPTAPPASQKLPEKPQEKAQVASVVNAAPQGVKQPTVPATLAVVDAVPVTVQQPAQEKTAPVPVISDQSADENVQNNAGGAVVGSEGRSSPVSETVETGDADVVSTSVAGLSSSPYPEVNDYPDCH